MTLIKSYLITFLFVNLLRNYRESRIVILSYVKKYWTNVKIMIIKRYDINVHFRTMLFILDV